MQHASSEMSPAHTWRIQLKHGDLVEPPSSDVVQGRVSWTSYSVAGRLLLSKSRERLLAPEGVLVIPARRAAHYSAGLYCAATSQMAKSYSIDTDWSRSTSSKSPRIDRSRDGGRPSRWTTMSCMDCRLDWHIVHGSAASATEFARGVWRLLHAIREPRGSADL